jgi:dihydroxy-acid dehydratase
MGTASTMASTVDALGMTLPGASSIPAADSQHPRMASAAGRRIVEMVWEDLTPRDIMTSGAFENAVTAAMALGGSTNAIIHLIAMAGRAGVPLDLDRFDALSKRTPFIANIRPSGKFLMEDFFYAGGLRAALTRLRDMLNLDCMTVTGRTLGEEIERAGPGFAQDVVRSIADPIYPQGGIAVLRGNLAPGGAIIKQSAADPKLMEHEGRAVVFENVEDLARRIDRDDLDVTAQDMLVLKNIGPKGAPGMPEAGYIPIPRKLARAGVKDIVRISDGRMSGTAFGTIVLHVTPESAIGGPLAHVRNGDRIRLSVAQREIALLVSDEELARRAAASPVVEPTAERGYRKLFLQSVMQADKGADFDFLRAAKMVGKAPREP